MLQNEIRITGFSDFHDLVGGEDANGTIFRGVKESDSHLLIPSIGRLTTAQRGNSGLGSYEARIFKLFKQAAIAYLDNPPKTDLDWLALAQHHGLPTRLLDWSYNPLIALFFAVNGESAEDSAVYAYKPRDMTVRSVDDVDPFSGSEIMKFAPDHLANRISSQKGLFTIHADPRIELRDPKRIRKIVIPNDKREELRYVLRRYDVNVATVFPGLDGLAAHISQR